jgi:predicted secreted protein
MQILERLGDRKVIAVVALVGFIIMASMSMATGVAEPLFRLISGGVELTEEDNGEVVALVPGQELTITLYGNPTTGYEWRVASLDSSRLRQLGEGEWRPESGATGSGGPYTFRFEAVGPGQSTLQLVNQFPGEEPIETFEVTVMVSRQ